MASGFPGHMLPGIHWSDDMVRVVPGRQGEESSEPDEPRTDHRGPSRRQPGLLHSAAARHHRLHGSGARDRCPTPGRGAGSPPHPSQPCKKPGNRPSTHAALIDFPSADNRTAFYPEGISGALAVDLTGTSRAHAVIHTLTTPSRLPAGRAHHQFSRFDSVHPRLHSVLTPASFCNSYAQ